jgi:hypothetical protein
MLESSAEYLATRYPASVNDLATIFVERSLALARGGSVALVTPLGWLFLRYYGAMRRSLLAKTRWNIFALLGKGAFEAISGHVVQSVLLVISASSPVGDVAAIDARTLERGGHKSDALRTGEVIRLSQDRMRGSADTLLSLDETSHKLLSKYATSWQGLVTTDAPRYVIRFWEVADRGDTWELYVTAPSTSRPYSGRECLLRWEAGSGSLVRKSGAHNFNPKTVLGKAGVLVGKGSLRVTLYRGEMFDHAGSPVIPADASNASALWAFMSAPDYAERVRRINDKVIVDSGYLVKVPFDVDHWTKTAGGAYPNGLPEPSSDDPTQWLFDGRPEASTAPLQVAVGRLVDYRWPEQAQRNDLQALADVDGIVCLPSVAGEAPAANRVQQVLATAFGDTWSPSRVKELLEQTGSKKKNLTEWLRDEFFKQHCALFGNRPFVWHIWDGQRDGFSALVNYHRLDRKMLEKLTYTYLGQDWVERQRAEVRDEVAGSEARLSAAMGLQRKLKAILDGEKPYDIYVRWKELHEQPVGWEPDLNDGVRLNIRPFVEAGVLRAPFNIHWKKDRGKDLDGTERQNDVHLSLTEKLDARKRAGRK